MFIRFPYIQEYAPIKEFAMSNKKLLTLSEVKPFINDDEKAKIKKLTDNASSVFNIVPLCESSKKVLWFSCFARILIHNDNEELNILLNRKVEFNFNGKEIERYRSCLIGNDSASGLFHSYEAQLFSAIVKGPLKSIDEVKQTLFSKVFKTKTIWAHEKLEQTLNAALADAIYYYEDGFTVDTGYVWMSIYDQKGKKLKALIGKLRLVTGEELIRHFA